jgi:hypothetical protein
MNEKSSDSEQKPKTSKLATTSITFLGILEAIPKPMQNNVFNTDNPKIRGFWDDF